MEYSADIVTKRKREALKRYGFVPTGYDKTNQECYGMAMHLAEEQLRRFGKVRVTYSGNVYTRDNVNVTERYDERLIFYWQYHLGYKKNVYDLQIDVQNGFEFNKKRLW